MNFIRITIPQYWYEQQGQVIPPSRSMLVPLSNECRFYFERDKLYYSHRNIGSWPIEGTIEEFEQKLSKIGSML